LLLSAEPTFAKGNDVIGIEVDQNGKVLKKESEKGEQGHKH